MCQICQYLSLIEQTNAQSSMTYLHDEVIERIQSPANSPDSNSNKYKLVIPKRIHKGLKWLIKLTKPCGCRTLDRKRNNWMIYVLGDTRGYSFVLLYGLHGRVDRVCFKARLPLSMAPNAYVLLINRLFQISIVSLPSCHGAVHICNGRR